MKIIADERIPFVKNYFAKCSDLGLIPGREITAEHVKDADALLVRTVTHVDKTLLQDSNVKFVGSVTAGADHLDTAWLDDAGISWQVATGFNAPPVADYVVSVIAALQKQQMMRQPGLRAAVIGVGNVGRLVAERLGWLGFEVICCDPPRAKNENNFSSVMLTDITDVDLVTLHVPLTTGGEYPTHHFIEKEFLSRQKPGCVLLNTSRGKIIDFKALEQHGAHLRWCFDVWEKEPQVDHYFLENALIATPHIAGYSAQSKVRGIDMIYRTLCERGFIQPNGHPDIHLPRQQLTFADAKLSWRDVVLGIFNPMLMTTMMQSRLLLITDDGKVFDDMRHKFTYRHEFAFTDIAAGIHLPEQDQALLDKLQSRDRKEAC
jgi:erythronate-4-phosphate dehydrogenase